MSSQLDNHLSAVGHKPTPRELAFIFCNGTDTPREAAQKSAAAISRALSDCRVTCFYNPVEGSSLLPSRLKPEIPSHELPLIKELTTLFALLIKREIQSCIDSGCDRQAIRIYLFLHSYGAVIAMEAVKHLDETSKDNLEIYSFGAAKIIPNRCARRVINFINEGDSIAEGTSILEGEESLAHLKQIRERERAGIPRFLAIFDKVMGDLFAHLNPKRASIATEAREEREGRSERYRQIFLDPTTRSQALMKDRLFRERALYYNSLFTDYTIVFLPGIPRKAIQVGDFAEFCKKGLPEEGIHSFRNHLFGSYLPALQDLRGRIEGAAPQIPSKL